MSFYVHDMLIFGTNKISVNDTKSSLESCFDMKNLDTADVTLGMNIIRKEQALVLIQSHYFEKVLIKFDHFDCKTIQ